MADFGALNYERTELPVELNEDAGQTGTKTSPTTKETQCSNCRQYMDTIVLYQQNIDKLSTQHRREICIHEDKYKDLQKRSSALTETMANIMEEKAVLENLGDEYSITKIGKKFENLCNDKWPKLMDWLAENDEQNEISRIQSVTDLLKLAYDECMKLSEDQIRHFLFLTDDDSFPTEQEMPALFKERRLNGLKPSFRETIQEKVLSQVVKDETLQPFCTGKDDGLQKEIREKLEAFMKDFVDLCWLFSVSNPPVVLEFDVVDKPYGEVKNRFASFSCQEDIVDETKPKDTVYCVVWPCALTQDGSRIVVKGDVATVTKGKKE